jgi:outer membrane receptor protein involved in Fe transport
MDFRLVAFGTVAVLAVAVAFPATAADDDELDKITIVGDRTPDYRTQEVQVGPLGPRRLMEVPYAIDVMPDSLSIVQQLKSVREVFRYLPSVQGEQWTLGIVESQSWIKVRNLNKAGGTTSRYDDSGVSSNATLSYKPESNMTVYVSYADSL